jgi:xylono-1,5-lactonase
VSTNWELLASGFELIEGPTIDTDGSLVFSDVLGGGVHRLKSDGSVVNVIPKRRGVGGIAIHAEGGLLVGGRDLQRVHDGVIEPIFVPHDFGGFNDFATDAAGRVYIGSVRFDTFDPASPHVAGELWRVDLDGSVCVLYDGVNQCNGVAVSSDGATMYHSDTRSRCVIVHDLHDNGAVAANRRHWPLGERGHPDGLAVDDSGAVWVADYGASRVIRFSPHGEVDGEIAVPANQVTSLCFDGADLVVVSADNTIDPDRKGSVFRTSVGVAGAAVHPARIRPPAT